MGLAVLFVFGLSTLLYMFLVYRGVGIVKSLVIVLIFVKIFAGVLYLVGVDRPLWIIHTRVGDATVTAMQLLLLSALIANAWLMSRASDLERFFRVAAIVALLWVPALAGVTHAAVTQVVVVQDPEGTPYPWYAAPLCTWQEYVQGYGYKKAGLLVGHKVYDKDDWALLKGYEHYNVYVKPYWTVVGKLYAIAPDKNYKLYLEFNGSHLVYATGGLGSTSIGPLPCFVSGYQATWKYQGVYLTKRTVEDGELVSEKEILWIDNKDQVDAYVVVGWMGNPQIYSWQSAGLAGTHVKYNVSVYINYSPTPAAQGIVKPGGSLGPVTLHKYDVVKIVVTAVIDQASSSDSSGSPTQTPGTPSQTTTAIQGGAPEELGNSRVVILEKLVESEGAALVLVIAVVLLVAVILVRR